MDGLEARPRSFTQPMMRGLAQTHLHQQPMMRGLAQTIFTSKSKLPITPKLIDFSHQRRIAITQGVKIVSVAWQVHTHHPVRT